MSLQTQAEMLIRTLAELRDAECEKEAARLRQQCKAHARCFIETFRPELVDGGRASLWTPQRNQAAQAALEPARDE